jgi:sporadic carbohydrate cluster protein (TIGR04323 family)
MRVMPSGYRGYVTARSFGGFLIPVPLQSLALRDYCNRNGMIYVLPVNENCFQHSYMVLEGMIQDLSAFRGVVMYSMRMLPQRATRRMNVYQKILKQDCSLHLVLEDFVVSSLSDVEKLEEFVLFDQLSTKICSC